MYYYDGTHANFEIFSDFLHPLLKLKSSLVQCKVIEIREAALTQDFDHSYCLPQNL